MKRVPFFTIILALLVFLSFAPSASAQIPFGGIFLTMIPCATPPMLWTIVSPPVPANLAIVPSTVIYLFGALHPGAWTLGESIIATVPCCYTFFCIGSAHQTASFLGTSM